MQKADPEFDLEMVTIMGGVPQTYQSKWYLASRNQGVEQFKALTNSTGTSRISKTNRDALYFAGGISSLEELAQANLERLAALPGISRQNAAHYILEARRILAEGRREAA